MKGFRAEYKGKTRDKYTGEISLFYEYRGMEYMIRDAGWKMSPLDSIPIQHKKEQKKIDDILEQKNKDKDKTYKYEDTADYGLNLFFELLGENEETEEKRLDENLDADLRGQRITWQDDMF